MLNREAVIQDVKQFIVAKIPSAPAQLSSDLDLFQNGILDSLGIVELVGFVEEKYGLSLGYDDLTEDNFRTLDTIANLIGRKKH